MDLAVFRRGNSTPFSSFSAIPDDLTIEILSRMSRKSLAKCRCVSKQWASILLCPDFTERFLTTSLTRPFLLFTSHSNGRRHFFSSPQPQNPDKTSHRLSPDYHMCFPRDYSAEICPPVHGLVCSKDLMVSNPTTGQYITLPKARSPRKINNTYFGYDPVGKQFKLLCASSREEEHQVMTLETGLHSWRMVECSIAHSPYICTGRCINGHLYYKAQGSGYVDMIVCFDVRSEKFKFITELALDICHSTLIDYKGKLGALETDPAGVCHRGTMSIKLWVLDDVEEQKWSSYIYMFSLFWKDVVAEPWLCIVGMTDYGEIVLSSPPFFDPYSIFYYNVVRKSITRVEVQGIRVVNWLNIYTYMNHVENVKPIQVLRT